MPIQRFKRALRARLTERTSNGFAPAGVGAARHAGDAWLTLAPDPQLVFPAPANVATLTLYLEGPRDGALRPRLYFNWGAGFSEADSVGYAPTRAALLRLDFANCPDLRRLRLDPHEGSEGFRFRWAVDADGEALARAVEPELADWEARHAPTLRAQIRVADYAPALGSRPLGALRRPRSISEHYLHACALAGRELAAPRAVPDAPLISFVSPLYNTPAAYLDDLLASFRRQAPGVAELVLSDDGSVSAETRRWLESHENEPGVVIRRHAVNRGIAAACNAGAAAARGQWIGFVDHDDALAEHAVAVLAAAIAADPQACFFYTDELVADARLRPLDLFDKPAFDDVLLSGVNYINHLSLYARDLFEAAGGFREGFDGSQDYDLLLRALRRLSRGQARHIPYPAYVWRRDGGSYSVKYIEKATANARRALEERYVAEVEPAHRSDLHRVRLDRKAPQPKVSVVVPNRDAFRLMSVMTSGLFENTDYPDFELIVVDNGSTDPDTLALYARLKRERRNFTLDMATAPFNFSAQVNRGVRLAKGGAVLLLNNDIEVIDSGWLAEMVGCLAYEDAGIVGARLVYPSGELQHAGVVVGLGGLAGHWYGGRPADHPGPMGRLAVRSTMSAVTGACMLISRACWEAAGPFDEMNFAVAYNDVDFCLRAGAAGFRTIYTPFATLAHHESASRGRDDDGPNRARFLRDQAALLERHGTSGFLDPVLSPWRDRDHSEPARIALETLPKPR